MLLQPATPVVAAARQPLPPPPRHRPVLWIELCLLLGIAQVLLAGYQLGVGNQTIQIPFLLRSADPALFANDVMVRLTREAYPSWFFSLLGWPARAWDVASLYLVAHLLTTAAVLAAAYALARAMFDNRAAALVLVLVLLAGHHRALAGDELYSTGFTHTYAVLPLALAALALGYRGRHLAAFVVAGLLFNLHALTAGYVVVFLGAGALADLPTVRPSRAAICAALRPPLAFVLCAAPTLAAMLFHRQPFDATWLNLTHIRSADHSFPSTWWQPGASDVPRFTLLAGLALLAMSFPAPRPQHRKTILILIAAAVLFVVGYAFTELHPLPTVIRAQLFRASRLVLVVLLALIAHGAVRAWQTRHACPAPWQARIEIASAALTILTVAVPALISLLPLAFTVAVIVALVNARLSWLGAPACGAATVVCLLAWRELHFPLIDLHVHSVAQSVRSLVGMPQPFWLALLGAAALAAVSAINPRGWFRAPISLAAVALFAALFVRVYLLLLPASQPADAWLNVQRWARHNTPRDALFLTPTQPGGFRIHSRRAVVGEWRDGTQLYFSADFAPAWWQRMTDLQPGLLADHTGRQLLSRGEGLDTLDDESLVALADKYRATHLVLPAGGKRQLPLLYANAGYAVYRPELPKAPDSPAPAEALSPDVWQRQEQFLRDVALPNIEKYRKSDATIQVVDESGRPVFGLPVDVRMTRQAFGFSASLPFFQQPNMKAAHSSDYRPPVVNPRELARFPEVFNYTMIPFSAKWMYLEPEEGVRDYAELDKYVEWCAAHDIRMQYHFVSGYAPAWVNRKTPPQRSDLFLRHARHLAERYGDKMDSWQIVNEVIQIQDAPAVFREMRRLLPDARLGIADCARFWTESRGGPVDPNRRMDMLRGLREIRWLKSQGIRVDFFGFHAHRPFGLWPDAHEMYDALDEFAKEGVKIHVTEVTVPLNAPVLGPVRRGVFTPQLQAEFYERFFTLCYSHPAVDMINLFGMGPNTWQPGSGLLDAQYNPKPAFDALKKLIREKWWTTEAGQLAIDGSFAFRGFHGDYELTVTLPTGQKLTAPLSLVPGAATRLRLQLDTPHNQLKVLAATTHPAPPPDGR